MSARIEAGALRDFAAAILQAAGTGEADARAWAETLVWANLRGVDSHGVLRIPRYLELIGTGAINPKPRMAMRMQAGAIGLLDADQAPGPVAMNRAMDEAIAIARRLHLGWVVARDITHAGAVGHFALRAAEQGMAGLVMTASGPLMAWPGSAGAVVSTNPLAIAIPAGTRPPLLLDMSTAAVALGKIMAAKDAGTPIPEGWGVDAAGQPTQDPAKVATLLPMAGPKGAGLSLMIECLASLAAGNPLISLALRGAGAKEGPRMNGLAIALDIAAFGEPGAFTAEVDALASAVAAVPASGATPVLLPGDRGGAVMARRLREGITLPDGTWKRLSASAAGLGVALPGLLSS
ncbi:Ldh family oxidoreductase [Sediminicoccus rosea]|jgi:ureidoglycolate dehydrogenase (NAD+)|uniref:Ldh family oxidoreductase n=1 Tax=Sediminicoccus rosea TaxID=1225128 RepID=A0ABZ0PHD3_9PROT|nr:Ldh family oxidoreductase [Sediminicoccus rosea]WPB85066.1 Ldh family oxidoreductase [Sediminicoccus rosea]